MFRQFLRDSALYGLAGILSRGISLLLIPFYTRALSPADFGVLEMMTILGGLVTLVVALEISQALGRYYAEAETDAERRAYASTTLWFTVIAFVVFTAAAFSASRPLSELVLESPHLEREFRFAVVAIACNAVFYLLQNQLRWQLQPRDYAATSIAFVSATAGVGLLLVVYFRVGVVGIFGGQIAGALTGIGMAWRASRSNYALVIDPQKCRQMLRFSLPLVVLGIAAFPLTYADRFLIQQFLRMSDVGVYGIGFRFASTVSLLMIPFQLALTPLVYKHYTDKSTPEALERIFRYFLAAVLVFVSLLTLGSTEILRVFTTPEYMGAASVIPVLAVSILLSNMYIFAPGLAIAKKTGHAALITIGAALVNLVLNLALIPTLGILGAAVATAAASLSLFTLYMYFSQRLYPVPHRWGPIVAASLLTISIALLGRSAFAGKADGLAIPGKLALLLVAGAAAVGILVGRRELERMAERLFGARSG